MAIHQEATFPVAPERVYELLTNGAKLGEVTSRPGKGGGSAGAYFSLFDEWLEGRQIELVPGERVVQAWRFTDWGSRGVLDRPVHADPHADPRRRRHQTHG
jgi:uncharacterized protein YndB with AHSA1/START domain